MLDSQQKRKVNQILYHRVTSIVLFIIVVLVVRSTWIVYQKKVESDELKNISLNYKNLLEERSRELNIQMERLQTDAGKEAEIRSKFSVAKDSENIVVIVDNSSTTKQIKQKSVWQGFLDFFIK